MEKVIKNLNRRGFQARLFKSADELRKELLKEIGTGRTVGIGGSVTMQELGLEELLRDAGNTVYCHMELKGPEAAVVRKQATQAEVYLLSCNALTEDGLLINVDGTGNRIVSSIFGVPEAIFITGKNKLCRDLEEGLWRIRNVANPKNVARLGLDLPCGKEGKCIDCGSPKCICRVTSIHEHPATTTKTLVYVLNEELGY